MPVERGLAYDCVVLDPAPAPMFPHRCHRHRLAIGAFCERCEAPLFPADKFPEAGHGYVACNHTGEVILGCPLGCGLTDQWENEKIGAGHG